MTPSAQRSSIWKTRCTSVCLVIMVAVLASLAPAVAAPSDTTTTTQRTPATAPVVADQPAPDEFCTPGQTDVIYGTAGADHLSGTPADDRICGLGGDDTIDGKGGNDLIEAGDGNDIVSGGDGADQLFGGPGADRIDGGQGDDGLFGGGGNDVLNGGTGNDGLVGGDGDDQLSGAAGNDALDGGNGADSLSGAAGDDYLDGGDGTDELSAAAGADICVDGETATGCEQGREAVDPRSKPITLTTPPVADPNAIVVDDSFNGVTLSIDTNGGIYPWDVQIAPARQHMAGRVAEVLAGPAFDISVPAAAPPIKGAKLTLPYQDHRLAGFPEELLRIYTFDPASQFWVPVPGVQAHDPVANTVTASLSHFWLF